MNGGIPDPLDGIVPCPQKQGVHDDSYSQHAEHVTAIVVSRDALLDKILESVDRPDVKDRHQSQEHSQARVEKEDKQVGGMGRSHVERGNHERGVSAKDQSADVRCRYRRDRHRHQGAGADLVKHDFDGE